MRRAGSDDGIQRAGFPAAPCCYPHFLFFVAVMLDFPVNFLKHYQQLDDDYAVIE
jgi:predicted LPLAT superfamily acyltransferase